ncbi:hypothetical protein CYY_007058 [Polysphondylium violaceum]|uniref:Uncharacterized protein n=1 Tax=Polysphondylium violaceum TaxID=133409 RepID=A0A8J4PR00_9MYCE|nr:hypothetical protein CYY_007058 [Polysphondylium violaceum]
MENDDNTYMVYGSEPEAPQVGPQAINSVVFDNVSPSSYKRVFGETLDDFKQNYVEEIVSQSSRKSKKSKKSHLHSQINYISATHTIGHNRLVEESDEETQPKQEVQQETAEFVFSISGSGVEPNLLDGWNSVLDNYPFH